jgi:rhodanese-related sulfurtransferase
MSILNFLFKNQYRDKIQIVGVDDFKTVLKNKKVHLIDVRTSYEFSSNKIKGAKNINYHSKSFIDEINKLDRNMPVLVYCKSGFRSRRSAKKFAKLGFDKIYDLKGGIMSWYSSFNH